MWAGSAFFPSMGFSLGFVLLPYRSGLHLGADESRISDERSGSDNERSV
jgi:hypothetical protein